MLSNVCVWSRQRSSLPGGFSLESSLRSPRYLSNYWTTLKNWCVFVWPCVVLRVFAGMSLPEGKLEGGFFSKHVCERRLIWGWSGCPVHVRPQRPDEWSDLSIWSGLGGQVCVWAMIPQRTEQDAERKSRWHLPSYHHILLLLHLLLTHTGPRWASLVSIPRKDAPDIDHLCR